MIQIIYFFLRLKNEESVNICRKIFYGLLQESGPLVDKAKAFLRDQLIEGLEEQQWIDFVFGVYYQADPNLIQNLQGMSIPIKETFEYIVNNIDDSPKFQFILQLLINQYHQVPSFQIEPLQQSELKSRSVQRHKLFDVELLESFNLLKWLKDQNKNQLLYFTYISNLILEIIRITPAASVLATLTKVAPTVQEFLLSAMQKKSVQLMTKLHHFLEGLFVLRNLPEKYTEWSSFQLLDKETKALIQQEKDDISAGRKVLATILRDLLAIVVNALVQKTDSFEVNSTQDFLYYLQYMVDYCTSLSDILQLKVKRSRSRKSGADGQVCSQETAGQLIMILNQELKMKDQEFDFIQFQQLWSLVSKLLLRVRNLSEVFEKIINAFLKLNEDLQQVMFVDILSLTSAFQQQNVNKDAVSDTIFKILLKIIDSLQNDRNTSVKLMLVKGWLAITQETANCDRLLCYVANFLYNNVNVGGKEGVHMCNVIALQKLEISESLLKLLVAQKVEMDADSLRKLLLWTMHNHSIDQSGSPAFDMLKNVSDMVNKLFQSVPKNKELLNVLFQVQDQVDEQIANEELSQMHKYILVDRSQRILEDLFDQWIVNDELASHIAMDGFNYFIKKLNRKSEYIPEGLLTNQISIKKLDELQEEELAKNIKIINLPGQNLTGPTDWSANKKGVKTRVALIQMTGSFTEEYQLILKLEKVIEANSIKIGFQTYASDLTDKILGTPYLVTAEIGIEQNQLSPIGQLDFINDEAYSNYQVKVFVRNFQSMKKRFQFIRFRFKRPVIQMIEGYSSYKNYKNICIGISFISILGIEVGKLPQDPDQFIFYRQETTALNILGKLCLPSFPQTIKYLANTEQVIQLVKSNFHKILTVLNQYEEQLAPLLLAIAKHNVEVGGWIVEQFLSLECQLVHAKLMNSIIMSNFSLERFLKLHEFVFKKLDQFDSIAPLIDSYCVVLLLSAKNQQVSEFLQEIALPVTFENIVQLVNTYLKFSSNSKSQLLVKMIVNLVYLQPPYVSNDNRLSSPIPSLDYIFGLKETQLLNVIGPLVIGSNTGIEWVQGHLTEFMQTIMEKNVGMEYLNSLTKNPEIVKQLVKQGMVEKIYSQFDKEGVEVELLTRILSNIMHIDQEEQKKIVRLLIQDVHKLSAKPDMKFVQKILVPLLNSERFIEVCLNIWDPIENRYISDTRQLARKIQRGQLGELINPIKEENYIGSELMTLELKQKLNLGGDWELQGTQNQDGDEMMYEILKRKVLNNPPYLILISGVNSGKRCICGIYNAKAIQMNQIDLYESEEQCDILWDPSGYYFYSEEGKDICLYNYREECKEKMGQLINCDGYGVLQFNYDSIEKIQISFNQEDTTSIKLTTDKNELVAEQFVFTKIEYWIKKQKQELPIKSKFQSITGIVLEGLGIIQEQQSQLFTVSTHGYSSSSLLFPQTYFSPTSPYNFFRASPTYNLPANIKLTDIPPLLELNQLVPSSDALIELTTTLTQDSQSTLAELNELVTQNLDKTNGIIDIDLNAVQLLESLTKKPKDTIFRLNYTPHLPVFNTFEQMEGVQAIIKVVKDSIASWPNKEKVNQWTQFIEELWSFCYLPSFFNQFMQNKQCIELLFQLLAFQPDNSSTWQQEEQNAVKFIYATLIEVFKTMNTSQVRELAIERDLLLRILDRIAIVSKEKKRVYHEQIQEEKVQQVEVKKAEDEHKKPKKKKGVGYGSDNTGQNQKWNTQEYVDKKKSRSTQLQSLLAIIEHFFDFTNWQMNQQKVDKLLHILYESALLPLLEAAFRSGSLLEMSKEVDLYKEYLKIVKAISKHQKLAPIFLEIPKNYLPTQTESLQTLLARLKDNANIFLSCLGQSKSKGELDEQQKASQEIAQAIIEADAIMEEAIHRYVEYNDQDMSQEILQKPLPEAYRIWLRDLRFGYVSFKDGTRYKHHYASSISSNYTPPQSKLVRLAQEFADMSTALPIEHTNSIFVRVDSERVDVMKAMIMGAKGTPYAHGAFVYDIFIDDNYPNGPPKMNLSTTGSGKVRFNPNLYACGKVCLSLLGTWRGHASENWDPKLSTLLQVLVSSQAIIMSEDIYFNEPGFEGEAGTDEGEKKNEAYSNIVRYCNIKFAMIDSIKNPPKGFETIIKRHFYLKKEEILEECYKWIKYAESRGASYNGLINDHNTNWCNEFKATKTKYKEMLTEAIKELEEELNKLEAPTLKELQELKIQKPRRKKQVQQDIKEGMANLNEIDVTDDKPGQLLKQLNFDNEDVRDRWSRYIGAMGLDAVQKQSNSSVFLSGLGPFGVEIAKNIVLSGVKRFTLNDNKMVTEKDFAGQFFVSEGDIGKNRALASSEKIQQLNYYVKVDVWDGDVLKINDEEEFKKNFSSYTMIVFSQNYKIETLIQFGNWCRKNNIKFTVASVDGVFARLINDWGTEFIVNDKNGEQTQEIIIKEITNDIEGQIHLIQKHDFEDGDLVLINNVVGMEQLNNTVHKLKVLNKNTILIGDTTKLPKFERNGTLKLVKEPIKISFESFESIYSVDRKESLPFDQMLSQMDFLKIDQNEIIHLLYRAYNETQSYEEFKEEVSKLLKLKGIEKEAPTLQFYYSVKGGEFPPLAAFFGGFVSQEIIKAITNKFMPVRQMFYTDCTEVLPTEINLKEDYVPRSLSYFVGKEVATKLEGANIFMVGCGAIGCELLKNFAMINLSTQGQLTITDPDHIETSNLNRQFLFREKHIRKPKSQTAAAAILQMNPLLKGKIIARLDKVSEQTENIFTDQFFQKLQLVMNALDNVQARRYVDRRCVDNKTPLLESGTLGPKGHVQCIIPFVTESYGSKNDPAEEGDIPYCTLKMFPEETFHCVEFARDKFGKLFTIRPKNAIKLLEGEFKPSTPEELRILRETVNLIKKAPKSYKDCVKWARLKFQKYFNNDIKQLLYTYPLDYKTKEGKLFWTMPKRPPQPLDFDLSNPLHVQFISTLAYLRARMFNLAINEKWRQQEDRFKIAQDAISIEIKAWKPSEEKKLSIVSQVSQTDKNQEQQQEQQEEEKQPQNATSMSFEEESLQLINEFNQLKKTFNHTLKQPFIVPDDFEKDNDQNGHIDFIHAFGNLRAANYKLEIMDWLTVKIKAGRIVPALATTTAVVAGLQTIELVKIIKKCKLEEMKNAFINIAIPYIQLTEPGPAPKIKLTEDITVTLWDRWDVQIKSDTTLKQLFELLQSTYKLNPVNVFLKSSPIFMETVMNIPGKEKEREDTLNTKLLQLLGIEESEKFVDLNINFTKLNESSILQDVPIVRVIFEN